jgi:hypothetical protein
MLLDSTDYRSFLVLHPRYKSSYFSKAGWLREWIDEAERLLRLEWATNYRPVTATVVSQSESSSTSLDVSFYSRVLAVSVLTSIHLSASLRQGSFSMSSIMTSPHQSTLLKNGYRAR